MKIQDFCDMKKFEEIMQNWATSTGLATVAVGRMASTSVIATISRISVLSSPGAARKAAGAARKMTGRAKGFTPAMRD